MEDPLLHWTPSIAPAGMALYRGAQFPQWDGSLFVSALVAQEVRRLVLEGDRVVSQEALFGEIGARLRDVRVAPDGALFLLTDSPRGQVLRVSAPR
jgi:glucose/arabinose dehydrogenase